MDAIGHLWTMFGGWSRMRRLRAWENVSRALGRPWGPARPVLRPDREELADGMGPSPTEKRGPGPERTPRRSAERRARLR